MRDGGRGREGGGRQMPCLRAAASCQQPCQMTMPVEELWSSRRERADARPHARAEAGTSRLRRYAAIRGSETTVPAFTTPARYARTVCFYVAAVVCYEIKCRRRREEARAAQVRAQRFTPPVELRARRAVAVTLFAFFFFVWGCRFATPRPPPVALPGARAPSFTIHLLPARHYILFFFFFSFPPAEAPAK